jgi:hypothetical protein
MSTVIFQLMTIPDITDITGIKTMGCIMFYPFLDVIVSLSKLR